MNNDMILERRFLDGRRYDRTSQEWREWFNPVSSSYRRIHLTYRDLPFADHENPYHVELLRKNVVDVETFRMEDFPCIEDIEIVFIALVLTSEREKQEHQFHYMVNFWSPSLGRLVQTLYRLEDLCEADFQIPLGDVNAPYCDFDQGYALLIVEHEEMIYILYGTYEDLSEESDEGYHTWFKVSKDRYLEAWKNALTLSRKKWQEWFSEQ